MKVLITGATSGIGFDVGLDLLKRGHFVYFTVHRKKQVEVVKEKLESFGYLKGFSVFQLDVTKNENRRLILELEIDCLFCNAGVGYGGSVLDIFISTMKKNFEVNVFSNFKLIQLYCGHLFLEKKKGRVIIMSSLAGITPIPFLGSYCATKASLKVLATCLKKELKLITDDIVVKLIEPGIFNTGFNDVMIENKKDSIYFNSIDYKTTIISKKLFRTIGCDNNKNICSKIIKAIESNDNRFIYSAPYFEKLCANIYSLFH